MKRVLIAILGTFALFTLARAEDKTLTVPSVTKSTFDGGQPMPEQLDKGAKGGPAERYRLSVKAKTKFRALLECDSCLPRMILLDGAGVVLAKSNDPIAAKISATLAPGDYTVWVASVPDRQGAYVLSTSAGEEIAGVIQTFTGVTASFQSGTKTVKQDVTVRVGLESVVLQESYDTKIFKTFKRTDIQTVEGSTTNKTNVGAAIMWGPSVAGAQQQKWIRVTAADQNVALEVPSKTYQLLLAELERIAKK
jgi:hypothetical protein